MVELRTPSTRKSPNGKLDALWDPSQKVIIIRNQHLHQDTEYHLHDDGSYEVVIKNAA